MDLASRKLAFIQTFLRLEDEVAISSLEQHLNEIQQESNLFSPMTKERLNEEMDIALEDSANNRLIKHQDLKNKITINAA